MFVFCIKPHTIIVTLLKLQLKSKKSGITMKTRTRKSNKIPARIYKIYLQFIFFFVFLKNKTKTKRSKKNSCLYFFINSNGCFKCSSETINLSKLL